ncbi:MAG: DUF1653 domain-containing protein [Clostridia bacterium]
MDRKLEIGKVYRHFKNKLYLLVDVALDCETQRESVVYRALYGDCKLWIRDKEDFLAEVGERKNKDNVTNQKYRFERIEI